ncbi:MAG: hypothetical protein HY866_11935 [Chloroflexi bacterium]|nr:hypothetical protein [Chloroflexota bacterium]
MSKTFDRAKTQIENHISAALGSETASSDTIHQISNHANQQLTNLANSAAAGEVAPAELDQAIRVVISDTQLELTIASLTERQRGIAKLGNMTPRQYAAVLLARVTNRRSDHSY